MTVIKTNSTSCDLDYPTVDPTLDLNFALTKTLDPRITFTRNSIGTYVGADGLIKTAVANEPRFDHDPVTKKCLGLMIEESRTNRIANSTLPPTAPNGTGNTIGSDCLTAVNSAIAPDGTLTAYTVNPSSPFAYVGINVNVFSVVLGQTYTASIWIKKIPGITYQNLSMYTNGWSPPDGVSFTSALNASTDWIRISVSFTSNVTADRAIWLIRQQSGGTVPSQPLYVWGPQIEVGTYATSYIPTTNSTVTRQADVAQITGTNFSSWYNSTEGTLLSIGETPTSYTTSSSLVIKSNSSATKTVSNLLYYPKIIQYPTLKTMNAYPSQVTDGLVLQLDAGNISSYPGSGTTWTDLSGNGNTGTLTNGPTYSSSNGGSIVFDGVDDAVTFPYSSSLNIGGLNITLSAWIRPTSLVNLNAGGGIIVRENGQNNDGLYEMLLLQNSGKNWLFFRMFNIGTYNPQIIPIELNTYYNIVCVYNNGIMRNYINGVEEGSGVVRNINITTDNTKLIRVGQRPVDLASAFPGNIAQTLIYNRALSATEVQQNFNALRGRFGL